MIKQVHLCDVCGRAMSSIESTEPDTAFGLTFKGELRLDTTYRKPGTAVSKSGYGSGHEFCSEKCFSESLNKMLMQAGTALRVGGPNASGA